MKAVENERTEVDIAALPQSTINVNETKDPHGIWNPVEVRRRTQILNGLFTQFFICRKIHFSFWNQSPPVERVPLEGSQKGGI